MEKSAPCRAQLLVIENARLFLLRGGSSYWKVEQIKRCAYRSEARLQKYKKYFDLQTE